MKKHNNIIITLLIVSIIFNIYILLKMADLREDIAHDVQYDLEATLEEDIDEIRDEVNQIKKEQQWISKVKVENGGIINGQQIVDLSWEVNDFVLGSEVIFYYRKSGEEDFRKLTATSQTLGNFEVKLKVSKADQPDWLISYQYDDENYSRLKSNPSENPNIYQYEYYIALTTGEQFKRSEIKTTNLKKIIQKYSDLEIDIFVSKEKTPSVVECNWDKGKIMPDKIFLEIYKSSKSIEEKLTINNNEENMAQWKGDVKSYDKLVLKVKYKDGKVFKKEIWDIK